MILRAKIRKAEIPLVRDLIRFAMPSGITNAIIQISYGRWYCGSAYGRNYRADKKWVRNTTRPDVKIHIPRHSRGAGTIENRQVGRKGKGYLPSIEFTRQEAILHLLAHELRHLYQGLNQKRQKGRVWGARGIYSERDCDAYAIRVVRHYRRAGSPFYGPKGEILLPS
jgi:hypothetical protein